MGRGRQTRNVGSVVRTVVCLQCDYSVRADGQKADRLMGFHVRVKHGAQSGADVETVDLPSTAHHVGMSRRASALLARDASALDGLVR